MTRQAFIQLQARIKLRQRHMKELDALVATQKKVLRLVEDENARLLTVHCADRLICAQLIRKQSARLIKLMISQRKARQQQTLRHQEEKDLLRQVADCFV